MSVVGDALASARMAYGIYTKLIVRARKIHRKYLSCPERWPRGRQRPMLDAPKEYPELANDVRALYGVLQPSHEHLWRKPRKTEDDSKIDKLKRVIRDTYSVLGQFKPLWKGCIKLRRLRKDAQRAKERPRIVELRAGVNEEITLWSYCRTSVELWVDPLPLCGVTNPVPTSLKLRYSRTMPTPWSPLAKSTWQTANLY